MARDLTDYERTQQAKRIKEVLRGLKENGHQIKGRMREIVAELLNVSQAQVGRMERIEKNLIPEAKAKFKAGDIGITQAYDLSALPKEEQAKALREGKKPDPTSKREPRAKKDALPEAAAIGN